ncbi:MAG TPA: protein kinase [Anaeromyxobacteraceae bacterium]|nr:protein kinase [Anaeromyxobacteraceae bacterium]
MQGPGDAGPEATHEPALTGVAPGALSALLEELARGPAVPPGEDARPWPLPGTVIGRFELVREVGRGGFGVVYEARDRELQRAVAFKLVRPGRLRSGEDQFRREAEVIARFSHPNLVTLFDVGRSECGPYLVLELLRGQTLHARLESGPLPAEDAVRVATEVARGLAHAHAQGVVHRDLKPSNVFLCDDGRVKLLDFGMSHAFGWRAIEGGTPAYMAPEQWRGAPEDQRTDVWALGALLFRMLSGELPFDVEDGGDAVLSERRAPALEMEANPALAALVARMLEKDPTARPRDGAEVLAALVPLASEVERGAPVGPVRRVRRARRVTALVAAGALLGVGAAWALRAWEQRTTSPPRAHAIAVLPFENRGSSADDEYFSDGLAEEILNLLTRVRELKVAASASTFRFKGKKPEPTEVADRLRVDVLLVGNVRRDADRLRIGAELVDAKTGYRLWSQIYDRRQADVFAVQDDIARQVVAALELVLSKDSRKELEARPPTANLAAYDLYLRGRDFLRRPVTKENLDAAVKAFRGAMEKDAGFAQAYAGLCEAWLGSYQLTHANDAFDRAEAACGQALERGRGAAEVHVARGNLRLAAGRPDEAAEEFTRAAAGGKPSIDALLGLARTRAAQRRGGEAEAAFERARLLDPADWRVYQQRAAFLFGAGRFREAAEQYREVVRLSPDNANALSNVGAAAFMAGEFEAAAEAWRSSIAIAPTYGAFANLGSSYFYLGRMDDAAAMYARAVELSPHDHQAWGNLADAHAFGGRPGQAREAYRRAAVEANARLRVNPGDAEAVAELSRVSARLGEAARSRELRARALAVNASSVYVQYSVALASLELGEPDEALAHAKRAIELGYAPALLAQDPAFSPLRGDPWFATLKQGRVTR